MTGKLRLEDLRVWRTCDCGNSPSHEDWVSASVADWVEVGRQLGAEIRETTCFDLGPPVRYLVFRLPVESPTPKED